MNFPDDDPDTIYRICEFIYVGSYSVDTDRVSESALSSSTSPDSKKTVKKVQESKAADSIYSTPTQRAHAKVYCCANKYDISVLKDRAYSLFVQTTHPTKFTWDAGLVSLVYENTDSGDAGLRSYVTRRCIDHYTSVLKDEKLVGVLNEHEPFIWKLGKDLKLQVQDYGEKLTKATAGLETLEVSLKAEKEKTCDYNGIWATPKLKRQRI